MSSAHGVAGWWRAVVVLTLLTATSACASGLRPMAALPDVDAARPCRVTAVHDGAAAVPIAWIGPSSRAERQRLETWCATIGAPVILAPLVSSRHPLTADGLVVVSWNVHEGAGDVPALIARLRAGAFTDGRPVTRFVLLLQEARRDAAATTGARTRPGADIVRDACDAGLSLYYVASKRIGGGIGPAPDRGNAILSTEPLSDFRAIELPFERQRRLAVEAVVTGVDHSGMPWRLRLVSAHLESTASVRRLRVLASVPRQRQARALVEAIGSDGPVVLGGDFNTWFGFADATYRLVAATVPDVSAMDRRRTFAGLFRLDHVFARPPAGWRTTARRLDARLGSDHFPLLAQFRLDPATTATTAVAPQSR